MNVSNDHPTPVVKFDGMLTPVPAGHTARRLIHA